MASYNISTVEDQELRAVSSSAPKGYVVANYILIFLIPIVAFIVWLFLVKKQSVLLYIYNTPYMFLYAFSAAQICLYIVIIDYMTKEYYIAETSHLTQTMCDVTLYEGETARYNVYYKLPYLLSSGTSLFGSAALGVMFAVILMFAAVPINPNMRYRHIFIVLGAILILLNVATLSVRYGHFRTSLPLYSTHQEYKSYLNVLIKFMTYLQEKHRSKSTDVYYTHTNLTNQIIQRILVKSETKINEDGASQMFLQLHPSRLVEYLSLNPEKDVALILSPFQAKNFYTSSFCCAYFLQMVIDKFPDAIDTKKLKDAFILHDDTFTKDISTFASSFIHSDKLPKVRQYFDNAFLERIVTDPNADFAKAHVTTNEKLRGYLNKLMTETLHQLDVSTTYNLIKQTTIIHATVVKYFGTAFSQTELQALIAAVRKLSKPSNFTPIKTVKRDMSMVYPSLILSFIVFGFPFFHVLYTYNNQPLIIMAFIFVFVATSYYSSTTMFL